MNGNDQKCSQVAFVTKFPVQLWAISWATTVVSERSPAMIVGVTNVIHGFSIPPNEKNGGSTIISKLKLDILID
jgi:hypothetical protein